MQCLIFYVDKHTFAIYCLIIKKYFISCNLIINIYTIFISCQYATLEIHNYKNIIKYDSRQFINKPTTLKNFKPVTLVCVKYSTRESESF